METLRRFARLAPLCANLRLASPPNFSSQPQFSFLSSRFFATTPPPPPPPPTQPPSTTLPPPLPISESMDLHQRGDAVDLSSPVATNPPALGIVTVSTTRNNTIITLADNTGRTRTWASGGTIGETNARKSTSFAAEQAAEVVGKRAMDMGIETIKVRIKGMGQGRDASVKGLKTAGVRIVQIVDATPIPHNGCRPPKRRRL